MIVNYSKDCFPFASGELVCAVEGEGEGEGDGEGVRSVGASGILVSFYHFSDGINWNGLRAMIHAIVATVKLLRFAGRIAKAELSSHPKKSAGGTLRLEDRS